MDRCDRCGRWFKASDSQVCDKCWEDMGQMSFFQDDDRAAVAPFEDEGARHPIDTVFDVDRDVYGKDW